MHINLALMVVAAAAAMLACCSFASAAATTLPADDQYVTAKGGDLMLGGQRVRFWGFIGGRLGTEVKPVQGEAADAYRQRVATARRDVEIMADRIAALGFNLHRSWEGGDPNDNPMLTGHDYTPGDGSEADMIAYAFNELHKRGIRIWMSSLNRINTITEKDVDIVDDPATAEQWKAAMLELIKENKGEPLSMRGSSSKTWGLLRMIDPRWEALMIKRFGMLADFPNKYKGGMRLGDDPQIAVWEISNEEFPFRGLFNGRWKPLPKFFMDELVGRFNAFLKAKYGSDEKLKAAWGFLLEGESLQAGNVQITPLATSTPTQPKLNDFNPDLHVSLQVKAGQYTRDDFNRRRGEDVIEFFCKLVIDHKQRVQKAMHGMGKSCRLSPLVFDSGNDFRIQAAYMHQFADAVSTCSYSKGMGHDATDKRFPFYSALDNSPKTGWTYPWFEQSTAKDKPHFVYETMVDVRTKYRAEYPMMVAALASINDWDIICWHTFSGRPKDLSTKENPWDERVAIWHDYLCYRNDEVLAATMKTAGEMFKNFSLPPAPKPTTFVFGRKSLYDPVSMDCGKSYGELGERFNPTAYRYGVQVQIDPTREGDEVMGPSCRPNVYESNPIQPNESISFDRQKAHVIFDAPAAMAYTGFFAQYGSDSIAFRSGAKFSGISVVNPPDMPYPVKDDEKYVSISLASCDGKPLKETKKALLAAVSTSFNTGYKLDLTKSSPGRQDFPPKEGLLEFWGAHPADPGKAPVLVARVGVTVACDGIDGMRYTLRDWHMRPIGQGVVAGGSLTVPAGKPVFVVELER